MVLCLGKESRGLTAPYVIFFWLLSFIFVLRHLISSILWIFLIFCGTNCLAWPWHPLLQYFHYLNFPSSVLKIFLCFTLSKKKKKKLISVYPDVSYNIPFVSFVFSLLSFEEAVVDYPFPFLRHHRLDFQFYVVIFLSYLLTSHCYTQLLNCEMKKNNLSFVYPWMLIFYPDTLHNSFLVKI